MEMNAFVSSVGGEVKNENITVIKKLVGVKLPP